MSYTKIGGEADDNGSFDDMKKKFAAFGKKMGESMTVVGGKLTEQMTVVGDKMKDMFHTPTEADRLVESATDEDQSNPDWGLILRLCDSVNAEKIPSADVARAIKKRLVVKHHHVQFLALTLLEASVKNCEKMFASVASEQVLDEMVKLIDDQATVFEVRSKALKMIESWGEATEQLRFLPVFEETYKSLRSRGVAFPGRDPESLAPIFTPPQSAPITTTTSATAGAPILHPADHAAALEAEAAIGLSHEGLVVGGGGGDSAMSPKEIIDVARNAADLLSTVLTSAPPQEAIQDDLSLTLLAQCRTSKRSLQRLIQRATSDDAPPSTPPAGADHPTPTTQPEAVDEAMLFEALSVHDEIDKVLSKYDELRKEVHGEGAAPGTVAVAAAAAIPEPTVAAAGGRGTEGQEEEEEAGLPLTRRTVAPGAGVTGGGGAEDDEKALAEIDEMIFGKKSDAASPAGTSAAVSVAAPSAPAAGAGGAHTAKSARDADDLIIF